MLGSLLVGVLLARNTEVGVAAALGAFYAPVVLMNLPLGVVLWVPLAFLSHAAIGPAPTLMMILIAIAWIGALPAARVTVIEVFRRHAALFGLMLGLLVWTTASLMWAQDLEAAASDFWWWWIAGAVLTVIATTITRRHFVVLACWAVVIGALISLALATFRGIDTSAATAQEGGRLGASGPQDPNYLAATLVPAAVLAAGLAALTRSGPWRLVLIGAIVALGIGLIATGSRGGVVAAIVAVAAAMALVRGRRLQIGGLIATGVLVIGGWALASSSETFDRIKSFDSSTGRVDLWSVALRMSEDNPVLGVGVNNFESRSADFVLQPGRLENTELIVDRPHVAHNVYLQQLAETGVIGLGLLIGFFGAGLLATRSAAQQFRSVGDAPMQGLASAVLVAQIAALSASVFLSNGYDLPLWLLLALGPTLASVAAREEAVA